MTHVSSREQLLVRTLVLITRGNSVDIVGDRGSGRTHFLGRLRDQLIDRDWTVLDIRGNASFRSAPLAAISLSGFGARQDGRPMSLGSAADELVERLSTGPAALFVDDWHNLDDASWGVLRTVSCTAKVPLVVTRTKGSSTRQSPTGLLGATSGRAFSVVLEPLRYDEFDRGLTERFGAQFEPATASQLYALAGGSVGVGFAVVEAALSEQRLQLRESVYVAVADLWCGSLRLLVEEIIEPLSVQLREALEILAFVGLIEADTLRSAVGSDPLEQLEDLGLISFVPSDQRLLVTVNPPLIVEYFRGASHILRRARLLEEVAAISKQSGELSALPELGSNPDGHLAHFVRAVHERLRIQRILAQAEWQRTKSRTAAANYVDATIRMALPDTLVDAAFVDTIDSVGEESSHVDWKVLHADHRAFHHGEPEEAVAELRAQAAMYPKLGGTLLAKAAELEHALLGNAAVHSLRDPFEEDLAAEVRAATHRALAYVHTSRGELSAAGRHLTALEEIGLPIDAFTELVASMKMLLDGDVAATTLHTSRGFDIARAQLDPERMRGHGVVLALSGMFAGRYSLVDDVTEWVAPLGDPVSVPPFTDRDLTIMSAVLAARRGYRALSDQLIAEMEGYGLPDGPLPGGSTGWAYAQRIASSGNLDTAADRLAADGDRAWTRGAHATAALAYLAALELDPTPERLELHRPRITAVEGRLVSDQLEFVTALANADPRRLTAAGDVLRHAGRYGLAQFAYNSALELFTSNDETGEAAQVTQRLEELNLDNRIGSVDAVRFRRGFIDLTEREEQVSRLAVAGLTNQQIASELVLSIRTVESHLHRVMRKAGVTRRTELAEILKRLELQ